MNATHFLVEVLRLRIDPSSPISVVFDVERGNCLVLENPLSDLLNGRVCLMMAAPLNLLFLLLLLAVLHCGIILSQVALFCLLVFQYVFFFWKC